MLSYIISILTITKSKLLPLAFTGMATFSIVNYNIKSMFTSVIEDMDFKKFSVIAVINFCFLVIFIFVSMYDYVCDLVATRAEMRRRNIPLNVRHCMKFYRTMTEMSAVVLFNFFIWIFAIYSIIIENNLLYNSTLWITAIIYTAAITHEFSSIGKNLEKANEEKPGFFKWIDSFVKLIERTVLKKLLEKCGVDDDDGIEEVINSTRKKSANNLEDKK